MKRLVTLALLVISFASMMIAGTTGKIAGTVTDASNGEKLVGVNVIIDGTRMGATTNIDGYFAIINIPPGKYRIKASLVGYNTANVVNVEVNVDETTVQNFSLKQSDLQAEEVVIVATRPVVQKDVAASRANISVEEIQSLPVTSVSAVVGLQAGIQAGLVVRGGGSDQTAFMMDGLTLRDERNSTPFTGIALSSVQDIQVQTGGFSAEYGNIRSGVVNVITKEGSPKTYTVSFTGRYSPPTAKNFGGSIFGANSYFIRPMIDDAVAWTGTKNGAWNFFQQQEYREWEGWNSIAEKSLKDPDPSKHLTPEAAKELFLFQHRKAGDIVKPDWDMDMGFGGPVPYGEALGNLRFFASYRQMRNMYILPLATDSYEDYAGQIKVTSDLSGGMKLMLSGLIGKQSGTNDNNSGLPGIFNGAGSIASAITSGGSFADSRLYSDSYWGPTDVKQQSYGAKFTHVLSPKTFYEVSVNQFGTKYNSNPGRWRNTDSVYVFGNGFRTDEAPFGFSGVSATGVDGLRMSIGFSQSRDSSQLNAWQAKFDFNSQLDRYNQVKVGFDFQYTDNNVNYGNVDLYLPRSNTTSRWHTYPIRGGLYAIDKIEYEGMNAELGLRVDYSDPQGDWYEYGTYDKAFTSEYSLGLDTMLVKHSVDKQITLSPRLAVAFPVTDNSKLYFNYGHFRQMPTPENLFLVRRSSFDNQVVRLANPNNPLMKTVAYELGYEQSMFDEFLVRISGYYKDVTDQVNLINFVSRDTKVNYYVSNPNAYEDIRGFELTIQKNRGEWITGQLNYTYMARTTGQFGFSKQYQNPGDQRTYERANRETDLYQTKSVPQPYARAIVDFFTPADYNPIEWAKPYQLLNDWRLNVTASWSNGNYFTWAGGSSIPGLRNNVQYRDNYYCDLRLSKNFRFFNNVNLQFIMDMNNVFNIKNFSGSGYGFWGENFNDYMRSLHLEDGIVDGRFGYINVPGSDKPGDVRKDGVAWTPIRAVSSTASLADPYPAGVAIYYDASTKSFVEYKNNTWVAVDQARMDKINEDKSYIRMPNMPQLLFLNPRHIYYGVKLSFDF
ncbi:MAG: TonB-dependent receptor [Acidobacteriota bacterium]